MEAFVESLRSARQSARVRSGIEAAVPHGRTDNGGPNDRGAWSDVSPRNAARWTLLQEGYDRIVEKHPKARGLNSAKHLGSLGTGNHFIELCLDEEDHVWAMLHSGSRGAGNKIGTYFIDRAKEEMRRYFIDTFLPDQDLAYLVEHSQLFDDYVEAVHWAQEFAWQNRLSMMEAPLEALARHLPPFEVTAEAINCHHNCVARENHFGANVWVTRKGAVRAREDDLGIIPGSMGTGSFIVRGKGSAESFCSCSHGAGRAMSRGQARKRITLSDHAKAMAGVECRLDADVLDRRARREPGGLQGHRRGHGRAGRLDRDRPPAAASRQCEGLARRQAGGVVGSDGLEPPTSCV
jgi:tRNA-splicing ligase RtcB